MNCKRYTIKAKKDYSVLVDPRKIIIECNPSSESLLFKDFSLIFDEYKRKIKFDYVGEEPYPLLIEEEIVEVFKKKNHSMNYLIKKFNLTV